MRRLLIFLTTTLLLTLLISAVYFSLTRSPHLSPIGLPSTPDSVNSPQFSTILGFLPFWNLSRLNSNELNHLTDLAYFGVELQPDGTVKTLSTPTSQEPGWHKLNTGSYPTLKDQTSQTLRHHLVIRAMDNEVIESIVSSPTNQQTAVEEITNLVTKYGFVGVNLDFEYNGTPSLNTIDQFTKFVTLVNQTLETAHPNTILTLDAYANAAVKRRLWDLPSLAPQLDYLIIMGYDFHRTNSTSTGAVAPLTGRWDCQPNSTENPCTYTYDLTTALNDYLKLVPADKLVLGLPLYGYEWQTNSPLPRSDTIPRSGSLASLRRVNQLIKDRCGLIHFRRCPKYIGYYDITEDLDQNTLYQSWDPDAHSPLIVFYNDNEKVWHQIYYENDISLAHKLQLASDLGLQGIAYWALGYR